MVKNKTEVLIIGGGVSGAVIAQELSRYQLDIMLLEKESDVAAGGPSKANTALIHAGFNADSNKLKGKLNVKGNQMYDQLTEELSIPFEWIGAMVIAQSDEEVPVLEEILENGKRNGVPDLEIVTGDRFFELEASLNSKAVAGLYAPTAGIICPYELTIALAQNTAVNGVDVLLETEVIDIEVEDDCKTVKMNDVKISVRDGQEEIFSKKERFVKSGEMISLSFSGEDYARKEYFNPTRILPTTVRVKNGVLPLVPVKTAEPIPKEKLELAMDKLAKIQLEAPIELGDVAIENILDTGVDVVTTRDLPTEG